MYVYFASRTFSILGMASTAIDATWQIANDTYKEDIDTGLAILEFDVYYQSDQNRALVKDIVKEGNYLLYKGVQGESCFTIVSIELDAVNKYAHVYAEDAGLDLINETAPSFEPPEEAQTVTYYLVRFLSDDFQIGINEIPTRLRTLSWDSDTTVTERLQSLASGFECEFKFRFEISGLMLIRKYLDIYERRGKDVALELRLGREIENIVEKRSITNLATALWATGSAPEVDGEQGDPITLYGYSYDDGDFYTDPTSYILKSRTALENWGRYNATAGLNSDHSIRTYSYDTTSQVELLNRAIAELKKLREPEVTYDVSLFYLPENLELGDTINLVDDDGELYLSARLLSIEISETNDTRTATFGDYIVKTSGISERLQKLADEIAATAEQAKTYVWIVYADDLQGTNMSLDSTGKKYIGVASNKLYSDPDLTNPYLYKWSKIEGQDGQNGVSPTVRVTETQSEDGGLLFKMDIEDYEHSETVKFRDGKNGEDGISPTAVVTKSGDTATITITDKAGTTTADVSDGTDISSVIFYYKLQNSSIAPSKPTTENPSGWSTTEPTYTEGSEDYLFTTAKVTYSDGSFQYSDVSLSSSYEAAKAAYILAEHVDEHFFYDSDGAHVTHGVHSPNVGKNLLMTSDGIRVRNNTDDLASFGSDGADIGLSDEAHVHIGGDSTSFYDGDGTKIGEINNGATVSYWYSPFESIKASSIIHSYTSGDIVWETVLPEQYILNFDELSEQPISIRMFTQDPEDKEFDFFGLDLYGVEFPDDTNSMTAMLDLNDEGEPKLIIRTDVDFSWRNQINLIVSAFKVKRVKPYIAFGTKPDGYIPGAASLSSGEMALAIGDASVSIGKNTIASGDYSAAFNNGTRANGNSQTVIGKYNVVDSDDEYALIIGGGTDDQHRKNVLTVDWEGHVEANGAPIQNDYESLSNKPKIEGVELTGDKTFPELNLAPITTDDLIAILV